MKLIEPGVASAALLAAALAPQAASAAIVVASSGPSAAQFPAGKKIDDAARISLQKGDSITVLDQRGTKVLRGPGRFAVSQPGRPLPNPAFAVLTRTQAASRARTGAVRTGEDGKPMSPNLWLVDVGRPGTTCIASASGVQLWRADDRKTARYRLANAAGASAAVTFAAGASIADWNGAVPLGDGAAVTIASEGGVPQAFTFAVIPSPPAKAEELAEALIAKGCTAQLDLLSATLAVSRF